MPSKIADLPGHVTDVLKVIGEKIKAERKRLKLPQADTAEASGIDRRTLGRIEKGQSSVTIGAYVTVMNGLNIKLTATTPVDALKEEKQHREQFLPLLINLNEYRALRDCAWHITGEDFVEPSVAYRLYQERITLIDRKLLADKEIALMAALEKVYGDF